MKSNGIINERVELRKNNPSSASNIIRRVNEGGEITFGILLTLTEKLATIGYKFHIAVEVQSGVLLKTIDNEKDALQTIKNIEAKESQVS